MVNNEDIKKMSDLCKLSLTDTEVDKIKENLKNLGKRFDDLMSIDTDGLDPLYNTNEIVQRLRQDKVGESIEREKALKNTKEHEYGYFKVLRIVE